MACTGACLFQMKAPRAVRRRWGPGIRRTSSSSPSPIAHLRRAWMCRSRDTSRGARPARRRFRPCTRSTIPFATRFAASMRGSRRNGGREAGGRVECSTGSRRAMSATRRARVEGVRYRRLDSSRARARRSAPPHTPDRSPPRSTPRPQDRGRSCSRCSRTRRGSDGQFSCSFAPRRLHSDSRSGA